MTEQSNGNPEKRQLISFFLPLERPMAIPAPNGIINPRPEDVPWLSHVDLPKPFADTRFKSGKNFAAFSPYQAGGEVKVSTKAIAFAKLCADAVRNNYEVGTSMEWPDDVSLGNGLVYTTLGMTTVLIDAGTDSEEEAVSNALERSFESLRPLELAYCLVSNDIAYPFTTVVSAVSSCFFTIYDVASQQWQDVSYLALNMTDGLRVPPPEFIDQNEIAEVVDRTFIARVGFPISSSEYWMREAERSLYLNGKADIATIQAFTAGEVSLDSLLMMLAWEEIAYSRSSTLTKDEVSAWYSYQNTHGWRVNNQFSGRLRGWDNGPSPRPHEKWLETAAKMRSQVVHTGHIPSYEEAEQVLECYQDVVEAVKHLLASDRNRTRYPRTNLLILSEAGLKRLGAYVGKVKRMYEEEGNGAWMEEFMGFQEDVRSLIVSAPARRQTN